MVINKNADEIASNVVIFHRAEDYYQRYGISSEEDERNWTKKYPLSFMFNALRCNEIPGIYVEKLARALKEDIEKSNSKFGKIDVVVKLTAGRFWNLEALIMAANDKEKKRIEEAMKSEPFNRTYEVLNNIPE